MLKSVKVPGRFAPAFERAEAAIEDLFSQFVRRPEAGTIHVGEDRYVLVRAHSLYLALLNSLSAAFGEDAAREFLYSMARDMGVDDCDAFTRRMRREDGIGRLAAGPVHFAFAGWARVEILEDSNPSTDDDYFLHYRHPNTFESEVVLRQGPGRTERPACLFSAGYSAGWCSCAFGLQLDTVELTCIARGDAHCEFIMAPADRLPDHEARWRRSRGG